jgi:hypothetical protein
MLCAGDKCACAKNNRHPKVPVRDYVVRPYRIAYRTNPQCATALRSCFSCAMLNPGAKSGLAASGGNIA